MTGVRGPAPEREAGFDDRLRAGLRASSEAAFIDFVLGNPRRQPDRYREIKRRNTGRNSLPAPARQSRAARPRADRVGERPGRGEGRVLDVRPPQVDRRGHVPGGAAVPFARQARDLEAVGHGVPVPGRAASRRRRRPGCPWRASGWWIRPRWPASRMVR